MVRLARTILLACAVVAVTIPLFAADDAATLRHLKEVLWPKAYAEQDVALLESILAEEFQMVDADGNWTTRADEVEWVRNNAPSYESLVFEVRRLDIFENGTAIVAGEGTVKGRGENGPTVTKYQSTNVLIKRDGKWRAIASHVSGIRDVSAAR